MFCQYRSQPVSTQSDETTIIHLEYGEPYAMKVACTVREGAGYFVNPPISYNAPQSRLITTSDCLAILARKIRTLERISLVW